VTKNEGKLKVTGIYMSYNNANNSQTIQHS